MSRYPTDPKDWQTSYTEKQAFTDSLQRVGSLLIPIAVILMIPILFSIFYLVSPLKSAEAEGFNRINLIGIIIGGITGILAIVFAVTILRHLLKIAGTFLKTFYDLPDSVDIKEVVNLRVFGRPPMPPPLSAWIKFPVVQVKNGKLDPQESWQTKIGGPVKLKIEPGNAIYLERGNRFSRVVGQGEAFLELHERIKTVLNISPQIEEIPVTAWTKDGIRIVLKAKGEYFLGSLGRNEGVDNELYSYNPYSVRQAVEDTFSNGKEGNEWSKSAMGKTIGFLGEYISSKYLDEIFISTNGGQLLSTKTMNDLLTKINAKLQKSGASLTNLQIIDVELPEQIKHQRIKLWETGHKIHATVTQSEVKAYQISSQKKALAETVRDFVFTLANGLERLNSTNLTEKLLSSIYEVINQGMKDPLAYSKSSAKIMPDGIETPDLDFNFGGEEQ